MMRNENWASSAAPARTCANSVENAIESELKGIVRLLAESSRPKDIQEDGAPIRLRLQQLS